MGENLPEEKVVIRSTSPKTGEANPIVLRQGDRVRLVFVPTVVKNDKVPTASVKGVFVYQKKRGNKFWSDAIPSIALNTLKDGEGVKLELKSEEVLTLFNKLGDLYGIVEEHGIQSGRKEYVPAPQNATLRQLLTDGELEKFLNSDAQGSAVVRKFMEWVSRQQADQLSNSFQGFNSAQLLNFDAAVSIARLKDFLCRYEVNLSNPDENFWQEMFAMDSWVISQLFTSPVVLIRGQVYVGGKGINGRGGNTADFLFKNSLTEDAALVEIKTPATGLLDHEKYRNNTWAPTRELSGGVQQALVNRYKLIEDYKSLWAEDEQPSFKTFDPKATLIIGNIKRELAQPSKRRCFEQYRRNLRNVEVVTFDEVYDKAATLVRLLERP